MAVTDEGETADVSELGLLLAFSEGVEAWMEAEIEASTPLDAAVEAGWAGLRALELVTEDRNGRVRPTHPAVVAQAGPVGSAGDDSSIEAADAGLTVAVPELRADSTSDVGPPSRPPVPEAHADAGVAGQRTAYPEKSERNRREGPIAGEAPSRSTGSRIADAPEAEGWPRRVPSRADAPRAANTIAEAVSTVVERVVGAAPVGEAETERVSSVDVPGESRPLLAGAASPTRATMSRVLTADVGLALQERGSAAAPSWAADDGRGGSDGMGDVAVIGMWRPGAAPGGAGPEQGAAAPRATSEVATAPQPDRERDSGGGMGSVHLDGRLVGYWLGERMARDAARPAAGTTFFDARQSPAWTPSGVL